MVLTKEEIKGHIKKAKPEEIEIVYIPLIMRNQTPEEVQDEATKEQNGKGLNAFDATSISKYHRILQKGGHLTPAQIEKARNTLIKYAGQFAEMTA
jgi:hypothetical protein